MNKKVLEIGCGSGHSLKYMASRGASELWGIDLSDTQIKTARNLLSDCNTKFNLFQGAMEKNPGIPFFASGKYHFYGKTNRTTS
ncbi:class I SAM-dependent methyltransferase [Paenibacillus sedimenti]|uniref:Class I SAM-dependent methyltransferase n=1 Tax=Paenibacillus sedimenti TaxID=2770274 RepID=A0A926KPJ9_9BACL|nr:class I SAM-dependent methyltransferase [Paenibacillus sedimenti]MBD0380958.1 class I SAM-dependent methyltransferase [Paenibacillus sedimenti]